MALHSVSTLPFWLAVAGVLAACVLYILKRRRCRRRSSARFAFVYRLLDNKYYIDWFNENVLAAGWRAARARACGRAATMALIDGARSTARRARSAAWARPMRLLQTGYHLLVRAGDDARRVRPADLAAVALPVAA